MDDARFERQVKNWKDYLAGFKETKVVFEWVVRELTDKQSKRWFKRMIFWVLAATIFQIIQPWIMKFVFDGLVERNFQLIIYGVLGTIFFFTIGKISEYRQGVAREYIMGITWGRLDDKITELFFEKSMGQHLAESNSLTVSNIDKGRWKVLELQGLLMFEAVAVFFGMFFSFVALWFISWVAGLVMTLILAIHLVWMIFLNAKVLENCLPIDREMRKLNRYRVARWDNIERVKSSGKETAELSFMRSWFDKNIKKDRRFWLWFTRQFSVRTSFNIVGMMIILIYGAGLVWTGEWTIGLLYPLLSWSGRLSQDITHFGWIEYRLNWNMPAVKSMIDALKLTPDIVDQPSAVKISQDPGPIEVKFDNVSFTYKLSDEEKEKQTGKFSHAVKNLCFDIKPGEKVALIGPSGVGKTTVMRLLLRFMDPDQGRILINGHDLKTIDRQDWMRVVGYIPQQAQVLDGTVGYNLRYGLDANNGQVSDEHVWQVMKQLRIDFGTRLNKGLDTLVGRDGIRLSGGQQQRLMIGAAAMKNPRFMIIDEATSNLDSTTEKEVQAGLAEVLKGEVSALVVAHRLSTVRNICSKFIVLTEVKALADDGPQIEATAFSFTQLKEKSPTFRQLAIDQEIII